MIKKITPFFFCVYSILSYAQIPQKCFEIESILVDACVPGGGCNNSMSPACSCEGKNEMVLFRIGSNPVLISNLNIDWPNNSFLGISTPDALTASLVASLNATIQTGCGWLIEPVGGILPTGKKVLLITSTDMCVGANSFADLRDTLIVIFQNPGNYQGHFANHNNGTSQTSAPTGGISLRTLIFIHTPDNCADTVTYDRQYLVNVNGLYGGTPAQNDGSRVDFDWDGTAHYVNFGCQAPYAPTTLSITSSALNVCTGDTINLTGIVNGAYSSVLWTGGSGIFSDNTALNTDYTVNQADSGVISLYLLVFDLCGDTIKDSVQVTINSTPVINIMASGPVTFCQGDSVTLTATGGSSYVWSNGQNTSSITVGSSGIYTVSSFNSCGTSQASITITVNALPDATITSGNTFCFAQSSVFLTAVSNGGIWTGSGIVNASTGEFSPQQAGTGTHIINYTVTQNACTANDTMIITVMSVPNAQVNLSGNDTLCSGDTLQLIASGGTSYLWSNGNTGASIEVYQNGNYFVIATNVCGTDTSEIVNITIINTIASFSAMPQSDNVPLQVNFTNTSINADFYNWYFGNLSTSTDVNPLFVFQNAGNYLVNLIAYNNLGCTDTASLIIEAIKDITLIIPNAISPNSDGLNDFFVVQGIENYPDNEIYIYNRWGNLIYHAKPYNNEWKGQSNNNKLRLTGDEVTDGTYFYVLRLNETEIYNGFIELLRK